MRCGNCPTTFCQYRRTDGECVFNTLPNSSSDKEYEPTDKSRLRDKESWITTAKKELECSDLLDEVRLEALKEICGLKDKMREICDSARELVEAVEGYVSALKKETSKYVFRNEVLEKCNRVKKLLEK